MYNSFFKRIFDIVLSLFGFAVLLFPILFLILLIRVGSKGPGVHWSKRIGKNNKIFLMPKLRSMFIDAPQLATDLMVKQANQHVTPIGHFLRKTSLDELPQLWSVLVGDMSLVGPRPALFNQYHLMELRTKANVHILRPGVTGWAQVNGRDNLNDEEKTKFDKEYLEKMSLLFDIKIIFETVAQIFRSKNVSH